MKWVEQRISFIMCTTLRVWRCLCVCVLVCLWVCLQTLLLDELADDVEDETTPPDGFNSELAVLADAEKCCANVDTRELLPTTTDAVAVAAGPVVTALGFDRAAPAAAATVPAAAPFVVPDERDNEEVEDWEPNGEEEAISAAAAEFAPPPYVAADEELDAELAAAEAVCDNDDSADADEFELVDEDDGDDDDAVVVVWFPAFASGGDSGIFRECDSNLAFNSSTLLNLNLVLSRSSAVWPSSSSASWSRPLWNDGDLGMRMPPRA